ncbi:hypothetical protein J6590_031246 [Homalodisca vitripennis]|nr:hypothetical protein J6590_031246 [Homalodisca vitripennis]
MILVPCWYTIRAVGRNFHSPRESGKVSREWCRQRAETATNISIRTDLERWSQLEWVQEVDHMSRWLHTCDQDLGYNMMSHFPSPQTFHSQ